MRAETGVGPSIASGSQTCRGICALLPVAPRKSRRQAIVTGPHSQSLSGARAPALSAMSTRSRLPKAWKMKIIPRMRPGVADAVHHEGLEPGRGGAVALVPEPDEQVGAEPHPLPAHEEEREAAAEHQQQHEEGEEVQVREEADAVVVVGHVAQRVDVDERADAGDDQHHHARERVDEQAEGDAEAADLDPAQRLALLEGGERGPAEGGLGEAQALGSADVAVEPDRGPGGEAERREDGGAGQVARAPPPPRRA